MPTFGTEGPDLLLGLADEEHPLGGREFGRVLGRQAFFALTLLEADDRDVLVVRESVDASEESLGDLFHLVGGDRPRPIVVAEEVEHGAGRLELGLVDVEIDPVEGFQLERHVVVDDFGHGAW